MLDIRVVVGAIIVTVSAVVLGIHGLGIGDPAVMQGDRLKPAIPTAMTRLPAAPRPVSPPPAPQPATLPASNVVAEPEPVGAAFERIPEPAWTDGDAATARESALDPAALAAPETTGSIERAAPPDTEAATETASATPEASKPQVDITGTTPERPAPQAEISDAAPEEPAPQIEITDTAPEESAPQAEITSTVPEEPAPQIETTDTAPEGPATEVEITDAKGAADQPDAQAGEQLSAGAANPRPQDAKSPRESAPRPAVARKRVTKPKDDEELNPVLLFFSRHGNPDR